MIFFFFQNNLQLQQQHGGVWTLAVMSVGIISYAVQMHYSNSTIVCRVGGIPVFHVPPKKKVTWNRIFWTRKTCHDPRQGLVSVDLVREHVKHTAHNMVHGYSAESSGEQEWSAVCLHHLTLTAMCGQLTFPIWSLMMFSVQFFRTEPLLLSDCSFQTLNFFWELCLICTQLCSKWWYSKTRNIHCTNE